MGRPRFKTLLLALLCLVAALVWYAAYSRRGELRVSFLDVGQGDAIFVESPTGVQVLIDGGPGRDVLRELGRSMRFYDRTIDAVIATHPDADHIGGLPHVLERYRVSVVLEPGVVSETPYDDEFRKAVSREGATVIEARRGMVMNLGGGAKLSILFPDRGLEGADTNDASVVAKLDYGETSFLFTGDTPLGVERYLSYLDGTKLDSDVLKVAHHGSDTSTSKPFAFLVAPEYSVVSAGKSNPYGHPHGSVIEALKEASSTVLKTFEAGTVTFVSDGSRLRLK